jgi:hypothetical protein
LGTCKHPSSPEEDRRLNPKCPSESKGEGQVDLDPDIEGVGQQRLSEEAV